MLFTALVKNHLHVVSFLVKQLGADIDYRNCIDNVGLTPLMLAAIMGWWSRVKWLCKLKANPLLVYLHRNCTAEQLALQHHAARDVAFFRQKPTAPMRAATAWG
jgi:ankyrin repeat protein